MGKFLLLTTLCWMPLYISVCKASCTKAEEWTETKLTCQASNQTVAQYGLFWNVKTENKVRKVAACLDSSYCSSTDFPEDFVVTLKDTTSTLTIKNVTRTVPFNMDKTSWTCEWKSGNNNVTACDSLLVYAKPEKPTCDAPVLNTSTSEIVVKCTTLRVYPKAVCGIELSKDGVTFNPVPKSPSMSYFDRVPRSPSISYVHTQLDGTTVYYKSECRLALPLSNIEMYGRYVRIKVQPSDVTSHVYSDVSRIQLGIINEDITVSEVNVFVPVVITLGLLLALTTGVVVGLAIVVCKSRRRQPQHLVSPELPPKMPPQPVPRDYGQIDISRLNQEVLDTFGQDYEEVNFADVGGAATRRNRYNNV